MSLLNSTGGSVPEHSFESLRMKQMDYPCLTLRLFFKFSLRCSGLCSRCNNIGGMRSIVEDRSFVIDTWFVQREVRLIEWLAAAPAGHLSRWRCAGLHPRVHRYPLVCVPPHALAHRDQFTSAIRNGPPQIRSTSSGNTLMCVYPIGESSLLIFKMDAYLNTKPYNERQTFPGLWISNDFNRSQVESRVTKFKWSRSCVGVKY